MVKSARGEALSILFSEGRMKKRSDGLQDPRDVGLVNELVQGVLRWRNLLDHVLWAFVDKNMENVSPKLRHALRLGLYQMLIMGTPPYAAVNSVVELFPRKNDRSFLNGVLRAVSRNLGHVRLPSIDEDLLEYASLRYSYPTWIVREIIETLEAPMALRFLSSQNHKSFITLRVRKVDPDWYFQLLTGKGYKVKKGQLDVALKVEGAGSPRDLPGFSEGFFTVQDEASMLSSLCLSPSAKDLVWDVCAAPGTKTSHLSDLMSSLGEKNSGMILASDIDESRLKMIEENIVRLKLSNVKMVRVDASKPEEVDSVLGSLKGKIDRILLDAPCSGLGVAGKNANLRWQRRETDIPKMAQRQTDILNTCAEFLRDGGWLVYSVCTLTREETKGVVQRFLESHPEFSPDPELFSLIGDYTKMTARDRKLWAEKGLSGPGFSYLLPEVHGTDGFFIAKFCKEG